MKKNVRLLAILCSVAIVLSFTGCVGGNKSESEQKETSDIPNSDVSEQTYVWCSYYSTDDFMKRVWRGFEEAGKLLGVKTVQIGDTGDDLTKYLTNVENAINMSPQGLSVMCFEADAYVDVINKAMDSGIPVITTAPDSPNSKRISYMGLDNYKCGEYAAQLIGEACGGEGEVMLLFKAGQTSSMDRLNGFKDYLSEHYPKMSVASEVNVTLEIPDQTAKAAAALGANPNIVAAYGTLGLHAISVSQACEELGISGLKILGMDTELAQLELVKEGKVFGTLKQGTFN